MRFILLFLSILLVTLQAQSSETPTIKVSAEGSLKTQPDAAIINLSIHSSGIKADSAVNIVDKQVKKLLRELQAYTIKEGSLDSSQTSIQPEYDYKAKPRKLLAYNASRYISFQLVNLDQLEALVDDISTLDLTNVNNISFTAQNIQELEDTALINAINTAKHKANIIAEELGAEIKGIYKVNHHVRNGQPVFARAMSVEIDKAKSSTYEQKDINISTNIDIEFEIK